MALVDPEHWSRGFVWADADETELAATEDDTGATWQAGFLRDPDGRMVVTQAEGEYVLGFERDPSSGALEVIDGQSTPALFAFEALGESLYAPLESATPLLESATPLLYSEGTLI